MLKPQYCRFTCAFDFFLLLNTLELSLSRVDYFASLPVSSHSLFWLPLSVVIVLTGY